MRIRSSTLRRHWLQPFQSLTLFNKVGESEVKWKFSSAVIKNFWRDLISTWPQTLRVAQLSVLSWLWIDFFLIYPFFIWPSLIKRNRPGSANDIPVCGCIPSNLSLSNHAIREGARLFKRLPGTKLYHTGCFFFSPFFLHFSLPVIKELARGMRWIYRRLMSNAVQFNWCYIPLRKEDLNGNHTGNLAKPILSLRWE